MALLLLATQIDDKSNSVADVRGVFENISSSTKAVKIE
jgi:hypothetical protein